MLSQSSRNSQIGRQDDACIRCGSCVELSLRDIARAFVAVYFPECGKRDEPRSFVRVHKWNQHIRPRPEWDKEQSDNIRIVEQAKQYELNIVMNIFYNAASSTQSRSSCCLFLYSFTSRYAFLYRENGAYLQCINKIYRSRSLNYKLST